jgi:putative ABC transport system permease protein
MTADVRRAVWSVDPDQPISAFATLNEYIHTQMAAIYFIENFVFGLGLLAMALSALGIYGVMAHSVVQERREIGIRMALGARAGQVVGSLTRRGLTLTAIGLAAGVPLAILIRRAVFSALSLMSASLPAGFTVTAVGILVGAALLASYLPARRAASE